MARRKTDPVETALQRVVRKSAMADELVCERLLVESLRQAIECKDFMRHVQIRRGVDQKFQVDYVPRREHATMQKFINDLKRELAELKGEPYVAGR